MKNPSLFWQRLVEALRDKGLPTTQVAVGRMLGLRQSSTQKWYSGASLPELENATCWPRSSL